MNPKHTIAASVLLVTLLSAPAHLAAKSGRRFLWLSDIHFNPLANPKLADELAESTVDQWPHIFASSPPEKFSGYGEDTNWLLLSSTLQAMRQLAPGAQFTVVTGDSLVHHFREKFETTAKNHDNASFQKFAVKTMAFLAAQLETLNPGKPVLLAEGNNDDACGDYALQPGGPFLRDTAPVVSGALTSLASPTSASEWSSLGGYSVTNPALKHARIIAVNSVYFSARYQDLCAANAPDPGAEEMQWLADKLAEARANKDKVWLIFHIPPGIDGYSTSHPKGGAAQKTAYMWKPQYTQEFQNLLGQYPEVTVSFAGHEHVDDFRLIAHSLVMMTPAVSPVVGQNPAFRVVSFRSHATLSDSATYYLANLDQMLQRSAAAEWKLEYDFTQTWRARSLDFKAFNKLYADIQTDSAVRERWSTFYSASHPQGNNLTPQTFPALACASGNVTQKEFEACVARLTPN